MILLSSKLATANELAKIEKNITKRNKTNSLPHLKVYKSWLSSGHGKKLRPSLLCAITKKLSSRAISSELIPAASAIELFHRASLIHDDIIDNSSLRRNKKTAHKNFNTHDAIILGDWLIGCATEELALCSNQQIREEITKSITAVCKGQLMQMKLRGAAITEREYFTIIENKTAKLFEVSAVCGALIAAPRYRDEAKIFGKNLGIAYQIINDLEDLLGNPKKTGKPICQDIIAGEYTLPLINLSKEVSLKGKTPAQIVTTFKKSKALPQTIKQVTFFIEKAKSSKVAVNQYILLLEKKSGEM